MINRAVGQGTLPVCLLLTIRICCGIEKCECRGAAACDMAATTNCSSPCIVHLSPLCRDGRAYSKLPQVVHCSSKETPRR